MWPGVEATEMSWPASTLQASSGECSRSQASRCCAAAAGAKSARFIAIFSPFFVPSLYSLDPAYFTRDNDLEETIVQVAEMTDDDVVISQARSFFRARVVAEAREFEFVRAYPDSQARVAERLAAADAFLRRIPAREKQAQEEVA
jgi:hypothetical protein